MIIRWKDIHERLEEAVDACENAADVLEAISSRTAEAWAATSSSSSSSSIALGFDFTNGFHDTANAIATSVSTHAMSPRHGGRAGVDREPLGAFVTTAVAKTVGKGIIDTGLVTEQTVLAALLGAIAWNLLTWWRGLPVELVARADRRPRSAPRWCSPASTASQWTDICAQGRDPGDPRADHRRSAARSSC